MEKVDHGTIAKRPKKKFTTQINSVDYESNIFFKFQKSLFKTKFLKLKFKIQILNFNFKILVLRFDSQLFKITLES